MKLNLYAVPSLGALAIAHLLAAAPALAQETPAQTPEAKAGTSEGPATIIVQGYRDARGRALAEKRRQTNISDRVTADSIGNLPDRNVAEAIARVPGVNLSLEQGEGRYISIRGIDPNLNNVQIDGVTAAAPGGSRLGRAVPLDTLGLAQIAEIEVVKSVTPDMDANALGGTLQVKTVSPFSRPQGLISAQLAGSYNHAADKLGYEGRVTISRLFGAGDRWGVAAAASIEQRDYSNHWVQSSGWAQRTIGGITTWLPSSFEIKPEEGRLRRVGGNATLEFRPDETLKLFLRGNYSTTRRREHTVESVFNVSNSVANVQLDSATTGVFKASGVRPERRDFRIGKGQQLLVASGGFEKILGDVTIESTASYSSAREKTDYNNVLAFRAPTGATGPIAFDIGAFDFVRWDVDYTQDTPSDYPLRRTREDYGIVDEKTWTAKLDLTWRPAALADNQLFVKAGFKYTRRDRVVDMESRRYVPVGSWRLDAIGVLPAEAAYDGRYSAGFVLDHQRTFDFIHANPALVTFDVAESARNSIEDDYKIEEEIAGGYVMGSATFGRLTLLGGLRWERTSDAIHAVEARFAKGALIGHFPTSGRTEYDNFFPNAQALLRVTNRLQLRAAFTQTIGRPAYEDARPLSNFDYQPLGASALDPNFPYTGTLSIGNPELKPYSADNYDLSLDWYTPNGGTVSAAAFRKRVENAIYQYSELQTNVFHSGFGLETLSVTSVRNANPATINGLELSLYQPFTFLPKPLDGFGIDGNMTFISSKVTVPTRPGESFHFFRQPSRIANLALFYEKRKFSARVAWSYANEQLYTLGSSVLTDEYRRPRSQVDALVRYSLAKNLNVSLSARNITAEPEQFSYGIKSLLRTSRLIDRDFTLSVSRTF